jgi:hypothetical protein
MQWVLWVFLGPYTLALAVFLMGTFGWFRQPRDPLAGVFLLPLGLPWNLLADWLGLPARAAAALLAPAINLGILYWLWRRRLSGF